MAIAAASVAHATGRFATASTDPAVALRAGQPATGCGALAREWIASAWVAMADAPYRHREAVRRRPWRSQRSEMDPRWCHHRPCSGALGQRGPGRVVTVLPVRPPRSPRRAWLLRRTALLAMTCGRAKPSSRGRRRRPWRSQRSEMDPRWCHHRPCSGALGYFGPGRVATERRCQAGTISGTHGHAAMSAIDVGDLRSLSHQG